MTRRSGSLLALCAGCALAMAIAAGAVPAPRDQVVAGKRLLDEGRLAEALDSLRAARAGMESDPVVDRELADYLGLQLYNLGVRLNNENRAVEALDAFTQILLLQRHSRGLRDAAFERRVHDASLSLARHAAASGNEQGAARLFRLLVDLDSLDARARCGLAGALLAAGDAEAADKEARQALAHDPSSVEAAALLGRAAMKRARSQGPEARDAAARQLEGAVEWFRRAAEPEPVDPARLRELGSALSGWSHFLLRAGDLAAAGAARVEAEETLRRAASLEPAAPWGWIDLAALMSEQGRYQEAEPIWARSEAALAGLLRNSPQDQAAPAWRAALASCHENRAVASYNLAVDALNSARFDQIAPFLDKACAAGPQWAETCARFRETARSRENAFRTGVSDHERALRTDPDRASDLLALGQIYEQVGSFDRALGYYTKLASLGTKGPEMADRIVSVSRKPARDPIERPLELGRARALLRSMTGEERIQDLESGVKAAAMRVSGVLGEDALQGGLTITVYPNRRSFREQAGYRVGSDVTGYYSPGEIRTFDVPSRTALDWVSVMTHELAHHAVERVSGGMAPRWLSEGVARFIEGDTGIVDRVRLRTRLDAGALQPLSKLDAQMQRGWNDPEISRDARDQALLAVEQMTRRKGGAALRELLAALAAGAGADASDLDVALRSVLGADLAVINAQWQAALPRPSS